MPAGIGKRAAFPMGQLPHPRLPQRRTAYTGDSQGVNGLCDRQMHQSGAANAVENVP